jgi:methionyl-tRNA synthetase
VGCESFKTPKDLVDGKCPDHGKEPVNFEQENYFFRLSKYRESLAKYYREHEVLLPANKINELLNFVENMEDISISRTKESLPRGVPVPGDEDQVMYVWFDALSNYI